jgi:hypothetical protein
MLSSFVFSALRVERSAFDLRQVVQDGRADLQLQRLRPRPDLRPLRRLLQELGTQTSQVSPSIQITYSSLTRNIALSLNLAFDLSVLPGTNQIQRK